MNERLKERENSAGMIITVVILLSIGYAIVRYTLLVRCHGKIFLFSY